MKKLLKHEICGSMNSARCALIDWKKGKKSQTLRLLFMHSAWTVAASLTNAWKEKKNSKMQTWFPNVALSVLNTLKEQCMNSSRKSHKRVKKKKKKKTKQNKTKQKQNRKMQTQTQTWFPNVALSVLNTLKEQ